MLEMTLKHLHRVVKSDSHVRIVVQGRDGVVLSVPESWGLSGYCLGQSLSTDSLDKDLGRAVTSLVGHVAVPRC